MRSEGEIASPFLESNRFSPRPWAWLFFGALAARLIYWAEAMNGPYFGYLFLDSAAWFHRAAEAAAGKGPAEAYFRAPLYHYLLTVQLWLLGPNYVSPPLIQHILGAAGAVLTALTARRLYSPRAGWIAGVAAALYAPCIYFEGEILDTCLQLLLVPLLLYGMAIYCERAGWRAALLTGAGLGLGAISRPNCLLFFPVFWLGIGLVRLRAARGKGLGSLARDAFLSGLTVCAFVLPVTLRNAIVSHDLVWVAWYGGVNFYIGNNPRSDGMTARTPARFREFDSQADSVEIFARREAEARFGRPLKASEADRYWFGEGLRFIREQPAAWARLAWKKWSLFWIPFEIRNLTDPAFVFQQFIWLRALSWIFNLTLLMPLALAGMALVVAGIGRMKDGAHERPCERWLIPAFILTYAVSVILFFVNARYRLPAVPALMILAAVAVDRGWRWVETKRWAPAAALALACLALGVFLNRNWFDVRSTRRPAEDYWTLGNAAKSRGKAETPQAIAYYRRALENDSKYAEAHNSIGEALMGQPEAVKELEKAVALAPNEPQFLNNLGVARELTGDLAGAEKAYRQTLALAPEHPLAWSNLGDALRKSGRPAEAIGCYGKSLAFLPSNSDARLGMLAAAVETGELEIAREQARWLQIHAPESWRKQLEAHQEWKTLTP